MLFHRFSSLRRRHAPRKPAGLTDRRAGAPARREPAPMPRMRYP